MRTSAIIRLILFSFTALLLTGILIAGMIFVSFDSYSSFFSNLIGEVVEEFGVNTGSITYGDSEKYTAADGSIEMENINNIDINWISGKVNVKSYDGTSVKFSENPSDLSDDEKMHYYVNNGKLTIQYRKSGNFSIKYKTSKDLEVLVPMTDAEYYLRELDVTSVSGGIYIEDMRVNSLDVENVSGMVELNNIVVHECDITNVSGAIKADALYTDFIEIEMVSGSTRISGELRKEINYEGVSGDCEFRSMICPNSVEIESVSGNASLIIPDNQGFTLRLDSLRAKYTSDFALTGSKTRLVYGDGSASFEFDSVSGEMRILKGE